MTKDELFKKLPKPERGMHVKLLTHTDADGDVPVILLKLLFDDITVQHCSNGTMDYDIRHGVMDPDADQYDMIFVTDISCKKLSAQWIDNHKNSKKLVLLDHHASAMFLNQYSWACVMPDLISDSYRAGYYDKYPDTHGHSSAASLVYDYFNYLGWFDHLTGKKCSFLNKLVHCVASYDTWDWSDVFGRTFPIMYQIDKLHEIYGDDIFEESFLRKYENDEDLLDVTDHIVLQAHELQLSHHLERVLDNVRTGNWIIGNKYYYIAYVNNTDFLNETADYLREKFPDVDLIVMNYGIGLSVRSPKNGINVGQILSQIGGGGHPGAGGCRIQLKSIIQSIEDSTDTRLFLDEK